MPALKAPRSPASRVAGLLLAAAGCAYAPPAGADLADDAERVVRMWSARGADVERRSPIFLDHGRSKALAIREGEGRPDAPAGSRSGSSKPHGGAGAPAEDGGCLTVVVLGGRSTEFVVGPEAAIDRSVDALKPRPPFDPEEPHDRDGPARSIGGAAVLSRCGAGRGELDRVTLGMRSVRGALEVLVARSSAPLGDLGDVLPERAAGPLAPRGEPGTPADPAPLPERVARAERRARADGAAKVTRTATRASASGAGQLELRLAEGCHRLEVMAKVPDVSPRRVTDVDAELREPEEDRVLARDRAEAADARLETCVGEATRVELTYAGASGPVEVTVSDASWPLAEGIPVHWGARARGGFAGALRRRRTPEPREQPVFESVGVQGATMVPIAIEPGACYLASVALIRGDSRGFRLAADVGGRSPHDEVVDRPEAAAIAFCSESETSARLEVETRGSAPWWALVVWQLGAARP